ncbi:uncharacterized protein LOC144879324 [Branchiostoma floridae x Branchiostoma japonicum]
MGSGDISVEVRGKVAIVSMDRGENRLNLKFLADLNAALDKVLSYPDVQAMVTTGVGKFYSNGIDLDWLMKQGLDIQRQFLDKFGEVKMRILTFPLPTIAAINGHCFAGGALLAVCHDYRVMRSKQGWFCMPEIYLELRFDPAMVALLKRRLPGGDVQRDILLFGKRFPGEECARRGVVDAVCEQEQLLDQAVRMARECVGKSGFSRTMMKVMKEDVYREVVEVYQEEAKSNRDLVSDRRPPAKL